LPYGLGQWANQNAAQLILDHTQNVIKPITLEGLKELRVTSLALSFLNECGLPVKFNLDVFLKNWTVLLENNMGVMWKYVKNDQIVGMLGGILSPDILDGSLTATETFWYVHPEHRTGRGGLELLLTFEKWAVEIGANRIMMAHLVEHNSETLKKLYERRGFKPIEIFYSKELWQ